MTMQHRGEATHDNIAYSRRIKYLEYGFEDRHGAILAYVHRISSRSHNEIDTNGTSLDKGSIKGRLKSVTFVEAGEKVSGQYLKSEAYCFDTLTG